MVAFFLFFFMRERRGSQLVHFRCVRFFSHSFIRAEKFRLFFCCCRSEIIDIRVRCMVGRSVGRFPFSCASWLQPGNIRDSFSSSTVLALAWSAFYATSYAYVEEEEEEVQFTNTRKCNRKMEIPLFERKINGCRKKKVLINRQIWEKKWATLILGHYIAFERQRCTWNANY